VPAALLQLPGLLRAVHVIREFSTTATEDRFGLSVGQLREGAAAQVFGAPISAAFNSPAQLFEQLGATPTTVRVVAFVMVVLMGATTFYTQKQMMARAGTTDPQQIMVQKFLLYVLPLSFAVSGVFFPIGVLLYWLTTNVWSMGQQAYVIKRMPPPVFDGKPTPKTPAVDKATSGKAKGAATTSSGTTASALDGEADAASTLPGPTGSASSAAGSTRGSTVVTSSGTGRPVAKRQSGTRKNKKNARGRR
jgi:YidC/Oxa1 family membrane protein insertase